MTSHANTQISKIIIDRQNKGASLAKVFIAEPPTSLEKKLGKLLVIIRVDSTLKKMQKSAEIIINTLYDSYYGQTPQGLDDDALEQHFEKALKNTNHAVIEHVKQEKVRWDKNKIHLIVALLKGRKLLLTKHGETRAFLLHRGKHQTIQMFDIAENAAEETGNAVVFQLFSELISGQLTPGDALFLCTQNILDFISQEKIKTLVYSLPAMSAAEQLKGMLSGASINTTFSAIITRLLTNKLSAHELLQPASQRSLDGLLETEAATTQLLSPKIRLNLKKYLNQSVEIAQTGWHRLKKNQLIKRLQNQETPSEITAEEEEKHLPALTFDHDERPTANLQSEKTSNATAGLPDTAEDTLRRGSAWPATAGLPDTAEATAGATLNTFLKAARRLVFAATIKTARFVNQMRRARQQTTSPKLFNTTKDRLSKTSRWYQRLPKKSRYLFIIVILAGFLFVQSLVWLGKDKEVDQTQTNYEQRVANISNLLNEAEAKIIYEDETRAREILNEASLLIDALPIEARKQKKQQEDFTAQLTTLAERLRHEIKIDRPAVFTTLAGGTSKINWLKDAVKNIYLNDVGANRLLIIDVDKQKEPVNIPLNEIITSPLKLPAVTDDNSFIFAQADNTFLLFDTLSKTFTPLTEGEQPIKEITDMFVYNNRLYLLDTASDAIWRIARGEENTLQAAQAWINEPGLTVAQAVSMTADGNIYVLLADGVVYNMSGGYRKNFELKNIDPSLTQPTKIWTNNDSEFLYILEPVNKRLVVINKNPQAEARYGSLVNQYTSDKFDQLKDFIVREGEKKIFLLNNNTVYEITASHLP